LVRPYVFRSLERASTIAARRIVDPEGAHPEAKRMGVSKMADKLTSEILKEWLLADQLRYRAEEARTLADDFKFSETKETLLRVAKTYDELAARLEEKKHYVPIANSDRCRCVLASSTAEP
jgi:Mn-dependent DtxR family transcriptional regulator